MHDIRKLALVAPLIFLGTCGGTRHVRPDDMSAARHREEADREGRLAREKVAQQLPELARPRSDSQASRRDYLYTAPIDDSVEGPLYEAELHRQHAREHARAAAFLERFEEVVCRDFPPSSRAACPFLGPVTRIDDIPGGVRATFAARTPVDGIVAHMRCHYAYARARAFAENATCPLYVRDIDIRRGVDPMSVEIVSPNKHTATLIRARSREQAVFVRGE
jgi:hypothetical protein